MNRLVQILGGAMIASAIAVVGCVSTTVNAVSSPTAAPRAAVEVAKDAWVLTATACQDAAEAANDDSIRTKCGAVMLPARDLILVASAAVDTTWSPKAACDLAQGVTLVVQAANGLPVTYSAEIGTVLSDAKVLVNKVLDSSVCATDAGAE